MMVIEELLMNRHAAGKENALSAEFIAAVTGLGSVRAVQKQIETERRNGAVILSSSVTPGGYYLPGSKQEVHEFIRTLKSRADSTLAALISARGYLERLERG